MALTLAIFSLTGCGGGGSGSRGTSDATLTAAFVEWNQASVDASGLDHTRPTTGHLHTFGHQLGPCRAARAMAIVHIAMFEALVSIRGGYETTLGLPPASPNSSVPAAIAQAAHDTLVALFPSQAPLFDARLAATLASVADFDARTLGVFAGQTAAAAALASRANDQSSMPEPRVGIEYVATSAPGEWRQDPVSAHPMAMGAWWPSVDPFVMISYDQFRAPPPPALDSSAYATAFAEVKALGGDGITTPTVRTADETEAGIYWAYDGTPSLCAPPRLYNQVARTVAAQRGTTGMPLARLLTLLNVAMSDAGVAIWDSKYHYRVWRPVCGIREADAGVMPSMIGDGNPATIGDPTFMPLGAPGSNTQGPNFSPPFPAYPSGHAGFGGALFQLLRRFYGTDHIPFTFVSDEYDGVTKDNLGNVRPLLPRTFATLSEAEEENGQSRIYLGIHWSFDKVEGIAMGRKIGDLVFDARYRPQN